MRRFLFFLVIAGFAFMACSGQKQPEAETRLFRDFSIDELVKRIHPPEIKGSSGDSSYSSAPGIYSRRDFNFTYTIEEGAGATFDEAGFIAKLKVEAARVVGEAGIRMTESGSIGDAFHFGYSDDDHEGWVEVVGTRMEGNRYKVWSVIRERTKNAKQ